MNHPQNNLPTCCDFHGFEECGQGDLCPLFGRASQKVIQLRARQESSPLIQSNCHAQVTDEQCQAMDDTLDAFGPKPTGNTFGSLFADFFAMYVPIQWRLKLQQVDWLDLSKWAALIVFVYALCVAASGLYGDYLGVTK